MNSGSHDSPNLALEESFEGASAGSTEKMRRFFQAFLHGPLYIPNRLQQVALQNLADYPNDFTTMLALQSEERQLVPVFSRPEHIETWCGHPLLYSAMSGKELMARVPDGWWLVINPGTPFSKEISPWEMEQLKELEEEGISNIIEELSIEPAGTSVDLSQLEISDRPELCAALTSLAQDLAAIDQLYLLSEQRLTDEGDTADICVIFAEVSGAGAKAAAEVSRKIKDTAARHLIGDLWEARVILPSDDLMKGVLRHFSPFFIRNAAAI
ncbi:MAG: SseB family protein [Deltaproteobacteria bacterium]|nr:SseB family protein [Deltaproteobacteria bacterium]